MARKVLDLPEKDKTTIVASTTLLDRVAIHVKTHGGNQTEFITRAFVNQLEKEGDWTIRALLEEEKERM